MTVLVVACLSPNPEEGTALAAYFDVALPLIEEAGGRVVQSFDLDRALVGPKPADKMLIVEYPDMGTLDEVFQSDAYQAVIPQRDRAFSTYSVSVIG